MRLQCICIVIIIKFLVELHFCGNEFSVRLNCKCNRIVCARQEINSYKFDLHQILFFLLVSVVGDCKEWQKLKLEIVIFQDCLVGKSKTFSEKLDSYLLNKPGNIQFTKIFSQCKSKYQLIKYMFIHKKSREIKNYYKDSKNICYNWNPTNGSWFLWFKYVCKYIYHMNSKSFLNFDYCFGISTYICFTLYI